METSVNSKVKLLRIKTFQENAITRDPLAGKGDTTESSVSVGDEEKKEMTYKVNVDPDTADPTAAWKRLGKDQKIKTVEPQKWSNSLQEDMMRFVCISDTHSRVERKKNFYLPDGDVLLFAGDMTMKGSCEEIRDFNRFIGQFPHKEKLVIAGNHDFVLEEGAPFFDSENHLARNGVTKTTELLTNCTFLQDELVEVAGIKIFGSPWVPAYGSPAFSLLRGEELLNKWNNVPESTDILMTHAPPLGIGDTVPGGFHVGCVELLNTVQRRVKPKYHVFGHIHEGYGMYTDGTTQFVNASTCATGYQPTQRPIVFDVKIPEGHFKTDFLKRFSFSPDARSDCTFDPKDEDS